MADIALALGLYGADLKLSGLDIARDDGLETAVIISLFSDRRALPEQVPVELQNDDRRGWWGDVLPAVQGDQTGSHLWLLTREKQTQSTLARAQQYARDALQWMIDDKVARQIDVSASYATQGVMQLMVDIYRPTGELTRYRYDYEWAAQAATRAA